MHTLTYVVLECKTEHFVNMGSIYHTNILILPSNDDKFHKIYLLVYAYVLSIFFQIVYNLRSNDR